MRKRKRFFSILLALAMILTFMPAMAFADAVANDSYYSDASTYANFFADGHYNRHSNGEAFVADNMYYVKMVNGIGSLADGTKIVLNNTEYNLSDSFNLSVGMNAFATFNYFKVIDGNLCAAFPVVLFDMLEGGNISIGDNSYSFAPNNNSAATIAAVRGQKKTGSAVDVSKNGDTYIVTHKNSPATEWVELAINELQANQIMITKKVITDASNNESITYGLTKPDTSEHDSKPVLAFYAFGWNASVAPTAKDGTTIDYQVYLAGSGKTAVVPLKLQVTNANAVSTLYADAKTAANTYKTHHYNRYTNNHTYTANDDFYVKAVTGIGTDVSQILINGTSYSSSQTFELSVDYNAKATGN